MRQAGLRPRGGLRLLPPHHHPGGHEDFDLYGRVLAPIATRAFDSRPGTRGHGHLPDLRLLPLHPPDHHGRPGDVGARHLRRPGGGGRDIARRQVPVPTNGEAICFGHTGTGVGFALLVESVRQLQGKAGKAQVEGAKFVIENSAAGPSWTATSPCWATRYPARVGEEENHEPVRDDRHRDRSRR